MDQEILFFVQLWKSATYSQNSLNLLNFDKKHYQSSENSSEATHQLKAALAHYLILNENGHKTSIWV